MSIEDFDKSLIGLSVEEAYDKIIAAGLQTNLVRNADTGIIEASKGIRIMFLMPNYITVRYGVRDRKVVKTSRG